MAKPLILWFAIVCGIALLSLTTLYWFEPADSLPAFLPGHMPGSAQVHFKHGLATLLLALAAFGFAWRQSKPQQAQRRS